MVNRYRNKQIKINVTEKEKELIIKKFELSGSRTFTEFVIQTLIYGKVFKIDTEDLLKVSYEINKVGVNINQIAHRINETKNIYSDDIEEIKNKMDTLNDFVKNYNDILKKIKGGI